MERLQTLVSVAKTLIGKSRPADEIHWIFEEIKKIPINEDDDSDEYYWFCAKYSENCYDLGMYQEAEEFLRKGIKIALEKQEYDEVAYCVCRLMGIMIVQDRYSEAITIGEKYETLCSGSDWVYEIETGLCLAYSARGWNIKAQKLSEKVIEHKRKDPEAYYQSVTCSLFLSSYNCGSCKNKIKLLSEWYSLECHVGSGNPVPAMEVLAEKTMVMFKEDKLSALNAVSIMERIIPVLENNELEYSLNDIQSLRAVRDDLKKMIETKEINA